MFMVIMKAREINRQIMLWNDEMAGVPGGRVQL